MFRFRTILPAIVAATLATTPAFADTILFNPEGTGAVAGNPDALTIDILDEAPGTASAQGITVQTASVGQQFTLLYQANVIGTIGPGEQYGANTPGEDDFFTVTAQFDEIVTSINGCGATCAVLTFALAPTGANQFSVYATSTPGDDLAGTGFNTGTLILQGTAVPTTGPIPGGQVNFGSVFTFTNTDPTQAVNLDQADSDDDPTDPINDYPNVFSLSGLGSATIPVLLTFVDPLYFAGLNIGDVISWAITNTSLFTPFTGSDPSALMFNGTPGVGDVDPINGWSGPDTILNADAQQSFRTRAAQVPEPASLTLFGLGLLGSVAAIRRRRQTNG